MEDLRSLFIRMTTFAGMFFASNPTVVDAGAADAPAGGDDASAEGVVEGDAGADDTSGGEVEETPEEVGTTEGGEGGDGDALGREEGHRVRDDRGLPANIKQALAKLREADPRAADTARRLFYEAGDFKQVFPTVTAAREAHDLLEEVGGAEGVASMRAEVSDYAQELKAMAEGDASAVEDLARDFPDGLVKLVPHALAWMQSINPDAYERLSAGIIAQTLSDKGVVSSLARLSELISDGKQQPAFDLAQKLVDWIRQVGEYGKSRPKSEGESDEMKRVRAERAQLEADKSRTFGEGVASDAIRALNKAIDGHLNTLLKSRKLKLTAEQRSDFQNGARTIISVALGRLPGYKDRIQELIDTRDHSAIISFISSKLKAGDLARKATNMIWQRRGFASARPSTGNGNRAGGGQAAVRLIMKPPADQIDWTKDRSRMRYMRGEATLKGGKVVRWDTSKL